MRFKNKKKWSIVVALILMLTVSLAACGGNDAPAADSGSAPPPAADSGSAPAEDSGSASAKEDISATLTVSMLKSMEPGMTILTEAFTKEYPNVTFEPEYIGDSNAFHTQVTTRFAAGNGSDLVYMIGGSASPVSVGRFGEAGYLLDLSDQPWVADMYGPSKSLMMYDDKVYGKDFGFSPLACLHYNKDFFEANNLNPPTTYAELVEVCKAIVALDVIPISWGAGELAVNGNNITAMAASVVFSSDASWLDKRLADETTFAESEDWKTTLTNMKELIDIGAFGPGAAAMSQAEMISNFASGKAAMMMTYGGTSALAKAEKPDLNVGLIGFPGATAADTRVIAQASGSMGINVNSPNQEAALAFLEFWAQPEMGDMFSGAANTISVNQANTGNLSGIYTEMGSLFADGQVLQDIAAMWPNTTFRNNMGSSLQGLFTGQKTVDQVLADLDVYFEEE